MITIWKMIQKDVDKELKAQCYSDLILTYINHYMKTLQQENKQIENL